MQDKDEACPVCLQNRFFDPSLKLLVSPCYHKMCETCINRLFLAGPAPCPICKQTLRKSNFSKQTFEDLYVEKEVQVRRKVSNTFNKRIEDFNGDLRKYNDYLEEVEEILFNLINNVDVQATDERIARFRQENKDLIAANKSKQMNEDKAVSYRLRKEREERQNRKEAYMVQAMEEARAKKAEKESVINELASSDKSANSILSDSKSRRQMTVFTLQLPDTMEEEEDFTIPMEDDTAFEPMDGVYREVVHFPLRDVYNDPWTSDFQKDRMAKGAGYMPQWTYSRAIMSAFLGVTEGV
ncbi:TFIIH/NER complex subunit [Irineochytrium annulatum]|nr:TFIIH/NER complex subunit [Irineochytrium annulatum]